MLNLTLVVPGLLGPGGDWPQGLRAPRLPALEMLIARGRERVCPPSGLEASLCGLFGLDIDAQTELPVAALTALVDCVQSAPAWLRADPVHLRPDMAKLILFDASSFSLSAEEASGLVDVLQPAMAEHGLQLAPGAAPERWYLTLPAPAQIRTRPPGDAVGRHIENLLPSGEEAAQWRALANECQMLLHGAQVNRAREAYGEPAINSLWFWGGGVLGPPPPPRWTRVWSDEPLARGLATYTGVPCDRCPENARAWYGQGHESGDVLVVASAAERPAQYADFPLWQRAACDLERRWIAPLTGLLRQRRISRLTLRCDGAQWTLRPRDLLRFWLRPHSLGSAE